VSHRALLGLTVSLVLGLGAAAPQCQAAPPIVSLQTVLTASPASWADPSYGLFRWESFPTILVVDTLDFRFQDEMFSRLAFFLEKRGFRGRLLSDSELAGRHGWNAHDYGAQELADFFDAAALLHFPLDRAEYLLRDIALREGVLVGSHDRLVPGEGGIISISRQSSSIERRLLLTHESFHGIFFASPDYRAFCFRLWDSLSPAERAFVIRFLDDLGYDGQSRYLAVNEFQAYLMQQPAAFAPAYFQRVLLRFGSPSGHSARDMAALLSSADLLDSFLRSHFAVRAGGTLLPSSAVEGAG